MYRWVTRTVGPLAAMAAFTAVGAGAQAEEALAWRWSAPQATPCPANAGPPATVIPGASPAADENPPSLMLALTAHGKRTPSGDVVAYRITATPASTPLHDVTVTTRLTCVPGDVRLAGAPSVSTGRVTVDPRAVTWHLDLGRTPATADFTVRVRGGAAGGPLVGELAATGPVSNCPELRAADTRVDPHCRVTVLVPGASPSAAGHSAPATATGTGAPRAPRVQGAPPVFPISPLVPSAAPAGPGAAGALPVLPPGAPGARPSASPSPTVLSQLDRPPIVPTAPAGPDAVTQDPAPPDPALRSSDTSAGDLGGRAFAFLIGGVAFLLLATAIVGSLVGARLRRNADDETTGPPPIAPRPRPGDDRRTGGERRRGDGPRELAHPADDLGPRPANTTGTLLDVVRRTAESGEPPRPRLGTDPTLGYDRPPGRTVVDE
jgi:hypothetical protein